MHTDRILAILEGLSTRVQVYIKRGDCLYPNVTKIYGLLLWFLSHLCELTSPLFLLRLVSERTPIWAEHEFHGFTSVLIPSDFPVALTCNDTPEERLLQRVL